RADLAIAKGELGGGNRHAGAVQKAEGAEGRERRLFRRFGYHGVAGGKRRGHLPEKDRERKIPRRDADEDATRAPDKLVTFAGGPGHRLTGSEEKPRLRRIVAAEVRRLAHLRHTVDQRLAGL